MWPKCHINMWQLLRGLYRHQVNRETGEWVLFNSFQRQLAQTTLINTSRNSKWFVNVVKWIIYILLILLSLFSKLSNIIWSCYICSKYEIFSLKMSLWHLKLVLNISLCLDTVWTCNITGKPKINNLIIVQIFKWCQCYITNITSFYAQLTGHNV